MDTEEPQSVWLNGRDAQLDSPTLGDVTQEHIPIRRISSDAAPFTSLPHGTPCRLIEETQPSSPSSHISAHGIEGWVPSAATSTRWSTFTFFGRFHNQDACKTLDAQHAFAGMVVVLKQHGFAIATEGAPSDFTAIASSAHRLIHRLMAAQAPLSSVPVNLNFTNWAEIPAESRGRTRTLGFMPPPPEHGVEINNDHISTAMTIIPSMAKVPYLDLAMSDFVQALEYPNHALIFLHRAIESVEYYFEPPPGGPGKEKAMREALAITAADVEFVTRRANESHIRHASRDGKATPIVGEDLVTCFKNTGMVLSRFAEYLTSYDKPTS